MNLASDYNALAFDPDSERDPYARHFIQRAGARNKNLSVQFDPTKHKEWVTGFHKRRTERKTAARKSLEVRAKQERLDDRQQRFEKKKQDLNLPDDYGVGHIESDEEKDVEVLRGQKHYTDAGVRTVVTTSAIAMHSDDEGNESSDSEAEDHHTPLGVLAASDARQNDAAVPERADQQGTGSKLATAGGGKGNRKPTAAGSSLGAKDGKRTSSAERLRKMGQSKERRKSRQAGPRAQQKRGKGKGKRSR